MTDADEAVVRPHLEIRVATYHERAAIIEALFGRRANVPLTIFAELPARVRGAVAAAPDACAFCGGPRQVGRYCYRHSRARYRRRDALDAAVLA